MTSPCVPVVALIAILSLVSGECINGWTHFDDSCYHLFRSEVNYPEALKACKQYNRASIVSIETIREHQNVMAFTTEVHLGGTPDVWIGLTDSDTEGEWIWESNGMRSTYTHWANGEPNQSGSDEQDCVVLYGNAGQAWGDIRCNRHAYYICETPFLS